MKTTKYMAAFFCLALCGCEQAGPEVKQKGFTQIQMGGIFGPLKYRTVVLDGNEYYAVWAGGGWALCPKLPPKVEVEAAK